FRALRNRFGHWNVYVSAQIADEDYTRGMSVEELMGNLTVQMIDELHLAVSLRSFRSEQVSAFIKAVLDVDFIAAKNLYQSIKPTYPIVLTRNLDDARAWVRGKARGTERYGLTASSGAKRLRTFGIWVQSNIDAENWFLNSTDDVRSSFFLEDTATEFDIQGLELDWSIVAWDADLRVENGAFASYSFKGSRWNNINSQEAQHYLKNAYRVLLTRARQGFVIFVPLGNDADVTRRSVFYDQTYSYLLEIGIEEI
ncbi:MAG: DUF2075 domain-containing protein, partial [Anaerolineae bacterium]|nr:DUF2075 domain-containing protein [Anaerolineae bacterium]